MITIVVPCFDEAQRLDDTAFTAAAAAHPTWSFLFVDDGSTDSTLEMLDRLCEQRPRQFDVLALPSNQGKGEAVRQGLGAALASEADIVGFIDADLSTPVREVDTLLEALGRDDRLHAAIGARVRRLGAEIERSPVRHITGRVYATAAALALGVGVYDTQCGAKVFRDTPALRRALAQPFQERWAFDVELLSRLTANDGWDSVVEVPLHSWHGRAGSKLGLVAAIMAGLELIRIAGRHRARGRGRGDQNCSPWG